MSTGEQLNIIVAMGARPSTTGRASLVGGLLRLVAPLIGDPYSLAINDVETGKFVEMEWDGSLDDVPTLIAPGTLIHVYTRRGNHMRGVITIEQHAITTIGISVPLALLAPPDISGLEETMINMCALGNASQSAILVAGPEIELDAETRTLGELIRLSLQNTSMLTFIAGPSDLLPTGNPRWVKTVSRGTLVGFRHRYAVEKMRM